MTNVILEEVTDPSSTSSEMTFVILEEVGLR